MKAILIGISFALVTGCASGPAIDYEPTRAWLDQWERMPKTSANCSAWAHSNPMQVAISDYDVGRYRKKWAQGDICGSAEIIHQETWTAHYIGTSSGGGSYEGPQNVNVWVYGSGI